MKTQMKTKLKSRFVPLYVALGIMVALPATVLADNLLNDVQSSVGGNSKTIAAGDSTNVKYHIAQTGAGNDGQNGCNASDSTPATVTINAPAAVSVSPNPLTFSQCGVANAKDVTFSSSTPGSYPITASVADAGTGTYTTNQSNFTLIVEQPAAPSDTTAPVISADVQGTRGDNGWYTSDVAVNWNVADNESDISSRDGCDSTTISNDTDGRILTCTATSAGGTSSESVTIKRDATKPELNPSVTPNPVLLKGTATASPNASDSTSGLASSGCDPVDTSSVGSKSVACSAKDNAGNQAQASATYSVIYDFAGVLQPVNSDGSSVFKLGSTVPVKFKLGGDSAGISDATANLKISKVDNGVAGTETKAISSTPASSGSLFRYDATSDQYIYNLGTKGLSSGTYQLRIDLGDGQVHKVQISLKK